TLRVDCDDTSLSQIEKQMHKLVNVLRITELAPGDSIERELALIKVTAPPARRSELIARGQDQRPRPPRATNAAAGARRGLPRPRRRPRPGLDRFRARGRARGNRFV